MNDTFYGVLLLAGAAFCLWEIYQGLRTGEISVAFNFRSQSAARNERPFAYWWLTFWNFILAALLLLGSLFFLRT